MNHAQFWGGGGVTSYQIEQSLRFNNPTDAHYLNRTPSTDGNRRTFTYSGWHKFVGMPDALNKRRIFSARSDNSDTGWFAFIMNPTNDNLLEVQLWNHSVQADAKFRDFSAWYHIVLAVDTTQATATDRVKIYLNGVRASMSNRSGSGFAGFTQNLQTAVNNTTAIHNIGTQANDTNTPAMPMYAAEIHFVDGTALDQYDFGEFDDNNVWRPINVSGLTYGTNGYYLNFSNSSDLGEDQAGSNDWTGSTRFTTSGTGTDVLSDTPTNNWCTLNPLKKGANVTLSDGNLVATMTSTNVRWNGTIAMTPGSGKYYAEMTVTQSNGYGSIGLSSIDDPATGELSGYAGFNGNYKSSAYGSSYTTNDIIGIAYDAINGAVYFSKNGTWQNSGDPTSGSSATGAAESGLTGTYVFGGGIYGGSTGIYTLNFGQRAFAYTPPTGYSTLNTSNLPAPDIADGSKYFNTVLYTGDGTSSRAITGMGFQPDFLWLKPRSTRNHSLVDVLRGTNHLQSNNSNAEASVPSFDSFDSDGFTVTADGSTNPNWNESPEPNVVWGWLAGGSGSSNTDGDITSTVSANQTAGFSIVSYVANGTSTQGNTVGHGLGVAPKFIIAKDRDASQNWFAYSEAYPGAAGGYNFNLTQGAHTSDAGYWNSTAPTSTVFTIGSYHGYTGQHNMIAYCFAEVEGYSKFGRYTGSGGQQFVHLGFSPEFVMLKRADSSSDTHSWYIFDATRDPINNNAAEPLMANKNFAEGTLPDGGSGSSGNVDFDFYSNGFGFPSYQGVGFNGSGATIIYAAFAKNPFGGSGVSPATAR